MPARRACCAARAARGFASVPSRICADSLHVPPAGNLRRELGPRLAAERLRVRTMRVSVARAKPRHSVWPSNAPLPSTRPAFGVQRHKLRGSSTDSRRARMWAARHEPGRLEPKRPERGRQQLSTRAFPIDAETHLYGAQMSTRNAPSSIEPERTLDRSSSIARLHLYRANSAHGSPSGETPDAMVLHTRDAWQMFVGAQPTRARGARRFRVGALRGDAQGDLASLGQRQPLRRLDSDSRLSLARRDPIADGRADPGARGRVRAASSQGACAVRTRFTRADHRGAGGFAAPTATPRRWRSSSSTITCAWSEPSCSRIG